MEIRKFILDLLFPIQCMGCGAYGFFICTLCESVLPQGLVEVCVFCGHPSVQGKPCLACAPTFALDRVLIASDFQDPVVRSAIHALKYQGIKDLAKPLGKLLVEALKESMLGGSTSLREIEPPPIDFFIIPLPLHKKRVRERGYNQAELLAHEVAPVLNVEMCTDLLIRTRNTAQQVGLSRDERRENIKNAFVVTGSDPVQGLTLSSKTIILVDDVVTTGATLNEAAKVLKHAGAKAVWGLVVARG